MSFSLSCLLLLVVFNLFNLNYVHSFKPHLIASSSSSSQSLKHYHSCSSTNQSFRTLNMLKDSSSIDTYPTVVIPKSYNVALGFIVTSIFSISLFHNYILGILVGLIGLFIAKQTGKVRFVFDNEAMEVLISKAALDTTTSSSEVESPENLVQSRENFAVGGRNRWKYSSFTDWFFIPSKSFPILMYFNENQTNTDKGQLHLFPVIMDATVLNDLLTERCGPSSRG